MNRTSITTRARVLITPLLAWAAIGTITLTTALASARDKDSDVAPTQERAPHADTETPKGRPPAAEGTAPRVLTNWHAGESIPNGYHPVQRRRTGLIVASVPTFAVGYGIGVLMAQLLSPPFGIEVGGKDWLYVPIIGPWVVLAGGYYPPVFVVMDGLAQAAAVTFLVVGLSTSRTVLVRNDIGRPHVLPNPIFFGSSGGGLGMVGTF